VTFNQKYPTEEKENPDPFCMPLKIWLISIWRRVISNGHSVLNAKYRRVTGRAWIAHRCNGRAGLMAMIEKIWVLKVVENPGV
jgi:hypothetical protein